MARVSRRYAANRLNITMRGRENAGSVTSHAIRALAPLKTAPAAATDGSLIILFRGVYHHILVLDPSRRAQVVNIMSLKLLNARTALWDADHASLNNNVYGVLKTCTTSSTPLTIQQLAQKGAQKATFH